MLRAKKRVRAFQNMQKELIATCHFSFERFKTKNVSRDTFLKHRALSCGCPAPLQSITAARGAGSALGLPADTSTRQLSALALRAPAASRASTSSLGLTALGCECVYGSPRIFPPARCTGKCFPKALNSCQMTETRNNLCARPLETGRNALRLGAERSRSSFRTYIHSSPCREPQAHCRCCPLLHSSSSSFPHHHRGYPALHLLPKKPPDYSPWREARAMPKGKVLCKICPGDKCCTSNFSQAGKGRGHTNTR